MARRGPLGQRGRLEPTRLSPELRVSPERTARGAAAGSQVRARGRRCPWCWARSPPRARPARGAGPPAGSRGGREASSSGNRGPAVARGLRSRTPGLFSEKVAPLGQFVPKGFLESVCEGAVVEGAAV